MTIQPIGTASVALYITPADLKEHGLTPAGLTLERALELTHSAFQEAGITLEGSIEIEAYPEACGVLVFARIKIPERLWFSFDGLEPLLSAAQTLPVPRPDAALLWWDGRYWLSVPGNAEQASNHYIAFKLLALIRDKVFGALRRLTPAKLEGRDRGDLISLITADIEALEVFYAHTISPICIAVICVIGMTGSGFIDPGGTGNGGTLAGYAMCNGKSYGGHMGYGYKRLELHKDNRIYIRDSDSSVSPDTTDAVEFSPAMIIDGETVVNARSGFSDLQPRACLGQSKYGEIIALLVEGRLTTSVGISVPDCAAIMAKHDCMQAMNLDGGTSAMIWYKGKYIMRSSNPALTAGRTLPNAFVYTGN